jgi:hypothetical protein
MNRRSGFAALSVAIVAALAAACSGAVEDEASNAGAVKSLCQIASQIDGKPLTPAQLDKLKDPVAQIVLNGACPKSFKEVVAKMQKEDDPKCTEDASRFVTETAQVEGEATGTYRAAWTRACQGRGEHELWASLFSITADARQLPSNAEMIGEERDGKGNPTGIYNYYEVSGGKWTFFGSNKDFVSGGYDCNDDGACVPKLAAKTRCAGCHVSGGLVMKELDAPWVHWEGDTTTPGLDGLFKRFPKELGGRSDGINMEANVKRGNQEWNGARIKLFKAKKEGAVAELLRPVFCTMDLNLQSENNTSSKNDISVNGALFVDGIFSGPRFQISAKDYAAGAKAIGQKLIGDGGEQLQSKAEKAAAIDTFFRFTRPEQSDVTEDYVSKLSEAGIVDDPFLLDVKAVDVTRPLFSKGRCDLLQFAPELSGADLKVEKVRTGFIANLEKATKLSAEGKALLANLKDTKDDEKHQKVVDAFNAKCNDRAKKDGPGMAKDVLTYAEQLRRQMKRAGSILEFSATMPQASKVADSSNLTWDLKTCELK